ncbi:MAG: peptidylprolyl isomerase [Lentisphaeria bacterium]
MIISQVNRLCQKHSRAAFLIIGVLIIIPFVFLWGSPGDLLRGGSRANQVGRMYGKTIPVSTFIQDMRSTEVAIFMKYGQLIGQDGRTQTLWTQETLRRIRALREAHKRGLDQVGPAEIAKAIQDCWVFQKDGVFDPAAFAGFSQNVLRSRGFDGSSFDRIVAENIAIDRLDRQVRGGLFVSPAEARQEFNRQNESLSLASSPFKAADYLKAAQAEYSGAKLDAAVADFYKRNVEVYRAELAQGKPLAELANDPRAVAYLAPYFVPEQKQLRVAVFPLAKYAAAAAAAVTDAKIQAYYKEHQAEYQREEVQARHILIQVPEDAADTVKAAKRKMAEGLLKQLQGGANFAALAKRVSEDPGSREQGGDLGWFGRKEMVQPFEEAVFALKKGQLSGVIETPFGFHLAQLQDRRTGRALDTVKGEIRAALVEANKLALAEAAAGAFCDTVSNLIEAAPEKGPAPADQLKKYAIEQKVEFHDTAWFRAGGDPAPFSAVRGLAVAGFKLSATQPVGDVTVGPDACYVSCWLGSKKPYLPALSEPGLAERVKAQMFHDRALDLARKAAQERYTQVQKKLAAGATLAAAAENLVFVDLPAFSRQKLPDGQPAARLMVEAVGERPAPSLLPPVNTPDGALLVYLKKRTLPTDAEFTAQSGQVMEQLRKQKEAAALKAFYQQLESESNTTLNEGWRPR